MQFNETLIRLRKQNSYTQEQLADKLNVSRQAVARWEAGETAPDVYILQKLCEIFGVSADFMLSGRAELEEKTSEQSDVPVQYVGEKETPTEQLPEKSVSTRSNTHRNNFTVAAAAFVICFAIAAFVFLKGIVNTKVVRSSPPLTVESLSAHDKTGYDFWTAEEYQKFMNEELEKFRIKVDSGESLTFYSEDGTTVSRPLTEGDYEGIKEQMQATLDSIASGNIYAKRECIEWKAADDKTYSIVLSDSYVIDDSGRYTELTVISDSFLTEGFEPLSFEVTEAISDTAAKIGKPVEEIFEPYKKYGLEYEKNDDEEKLYYNGKPVRKFIDFTPDGGIFIYSSDGGGDIDVQSVYDDEGNLIGLKNTKE